MLKRTRLSLWQFLIDLPSGHVEVLLEKHGLKDENGKYAWVSASDVRDYLKPMLLEATQNELLDLLQEIVSTKSSLSNYLDNWKAFDERWDDLVRCLELNGYKIEEGKLIAVDPTVGDDPPLEDELSTEINRSRLADASQILDAFQDSAQAYRKTPPDYNACLTHARIALETLARAIATARKSTYPGSFDETKWGAVLDYLCGSDLITLEERRALAGAYGLLSEGPHRPIDSTGEGMVLLARRLATSMCYFLVKRYNQ